MLFHAHQIKIIACLLFCLLCSSVSVAKDKTEPSNAEELAKKKIQIQKEVDDKYAKWKLTLSPEQQAWETVLEQNLGTFYLPRYKAVKMLNRTTAWDYVKDDPQLPRILIIGDSISRGYTQAVRTALKGKANLHRAPANCGPTKVGLKKLDIWLGTGKWDVITFNFGIHDRKTAIPKYEENLKSLIVRLKKTNAKLLWVDTTPIPDATIYGPSTAIVERNRVASNVMKQTGIPICELYEWITPDIEKYQNKGDCHFSGAGYNRLGEKVTQSILTQLPKSK